MTLDQYRALVAREFCRDHELDACEIGQRAAAAAVAVLDTHHLKLTSREDDDDVSAA